MEWREGYTADVEYSAGFYREQTPAYLNFVCWLNGFEPVPLDQPFSYCELGFGQGLTLNILAATNPHATFYGADFNPAQVARARQLANSAELNNITLLENSFAELAEGKAALPQFDFITLHGVYTWVHAENRRYIVDFIDRYLKPGGIVYVSYNAMPGWSAMLPLQKLIMQHAGLHPGRSDTQVNQARQFIDQLKGLDAEYFTQNAASPTFKRRMDTLKSETPSYLVHEYMNRDWQPMYHVDVARDMARAKLDYLGSGDLLAAFPHLRLTPHALEFSNAIADSSMRETVKDYFLNTCFRRDVYMRGARRMVPAQKSEWMQQMRLALVAICEPGRLSASLPIDIPGFNKEPCIAILDALAEGPRTLAELATLPALRDEKERFVEFAAIMTASRHTSIQFGGTLNPEASSARKLNLAIAQQSRFSDHYQALASPVLGAGVWAGLMVRLVYLCLSRQPDVFDANQIACEVVQMMAAHQEPTDPAAESISEEQRNADLKAVVNVILMRWVPIWRQLKIL